MDRIAIVGVGLIGGSLGLALKKSGVGDLEVAGYDADREALRRAKTAGAVDVAAASLADAARGAGVVVVATPISAVRDVLAALGSAVREGAVITDVASTKQQVMAWAREALPDTVSFVGGHPMAGKETAGIENADADLFRDRAYCIAPSPLASESAVQSVVNLATAVGANPIFVDPGEHDQYVAAVSHLPMVVAYALFSTARASGSWHDIAPLAGPGFRDTTRLASGDPLLARDITSTNRDAIVTWLDRMAAELISYRDLVADGSLEELEEAFSQVEESRARFLAGVDRPPEPERGEVVAVSPFRSMFLGGWVSDRWDRLERELRQREEDVRRRRRR